MAGSIRAVRGKADKWELRVYVGRDSEGLVRHKQVTFNGSRRQAEKELARMVAMQEEAPSPGPAPVIEEKRWGPSTTINDAIGAWQANGWEDLSPKTQRHYESIWRVHIADSIGARKVSSLSTYDIERFYRSLKAAGLSPSTVKQVRAVIHRACRLVSKWSNGSLPNPAADADLPSWRLEDRPDEVRAPSLEEVLALIAAAGGDRRLAAFIRLLAATGMRRGEACALRWRDLDTNELVVTVDESVVGARGGAVVKGPKTRASVRRVSCDSGTMHLLMELRVEQEELAGACGESVTGDSFVFSFEPGGAVPPYPDSFSHAMTRLRRKACVADDVHLHSLRHFHATTLDPVISEAQKQARLGWSTVQMARHYTDQVAAEDRRAAEHVGSMLDTA